MSDLLTLAWRLYLEILHFVQGDETPGVIEMLPKKHKIKLKSFANEAMTHQNLLDCSL
jgi:hypothetical protein